MPKNYAALPGKIEPWGFNGGLHVNCGLGDRGERGGFGGITQSNIHLVSRFEHVLRVDAHRRKESRIAVAEKRYGWSEPKEANQTGSEHREAAPMAQLPGAESRNSLSCRLGIGWQPPGGRRPAPQRDAR